MRSSLDNEEKPRMCAKEERKRLQRTHVRPANFLKSEHFLKVGIPAKEMMGILGEGAKPILNHR